MFSGSRKALILGALCLAASPVAFAAGDEGAASHGPGSALLWFGLLLIIAKVAASFVERLGQPPVLGELAVGVLLGNLILLGMPFFEAAKSDVHIAWLAQVGAVVLLFMSGLETNIHEMRRVGGRAFLVACVGVAVPFALGVLLGPVLFEGMSQNGAIFLGATLTATSVGITARVFGDLGKSKTPEAKIVLGAAVIDDVLGLIILAGVSALVKAGVVGFGTIATITLVAVGFLAGAIVAGRFFAPYLGHWFSRIHSGEGMKFTLATSFCFILAWAAGEAGLAAIVGGFAAGLVLDPVHFRLFRKPEHAEKLEEYAAHLPVAHREQAVAHAEGETEKHVEYLVKPVAFLLVPLFFVKTGMDVRLETLFDPKLIGVALAITAIACVGKIVSGLAAGKVDKWIVGVGMIPRGEVGLIFAAIGRGLGVVTDDVFSAIIVMVILTTLLTPLALTYLLKRPSAREASPVIA
jgi:Kef-type K+ transport system membrane component KefB